MNLCFVQKSGNFHSILDFWTIFFKKITEKKESDDYGHNFIAYIKSNRITSTTLDNTYVTH
jgi:hypothetical protein